MIKVNIKIEPRSKLLEDIEVGDVFVSFNTRPSFSETPGVFVKTDRKTLAGCEYLHSCVDLTTGFLHDFRCNKRVELVENPAFTCKLDNN